jgi:tRNA threonylcarbamoyl adenosine modification protein YeaZ
MTILAVDTSGSFCSVALSAPSGVVSLSSGGGNDHFEQLPRMVSELFERAGLEPSVLKEIRVGLGPGSFTGLRIGMSFVKGLSWSLRVPVVGCSSFAAVAAAAFARNASAESVVVIADARREEVFAGRYARTTGVDVEPCIVPVSALAGDPWCVNDPGVVVVSPQRDFSVIGVQPGVEGESAKGLLLLPSVGNPTFLVEEISVIEPTYLRAVAAKTIAERKIGA